MTNTLARRSPESIIQHESNEQLDLYTNWLKEKLPLPAFDLRETHLEAENYNPLISAANIGTMPKDDFKTYQINLQSALMPSWHLEKEDAHRELSFHALQEWEGYVIDIAEDSFTARLTDITRRSMVEEESAEFPKSEVSDDDLALIEEGAIFRWVIGFQRSRGGTKRRVSEIVFRRLPAWTKRDLYEAKELAATLSKELAEE